jgi:hypothetical protein
MGKLEFYYIDTRWRGPWWWQQPVYYLVCDRRGRYGPYYNRQEVHAEARRVGLQPAPARAGENA